MNDFDGGLNQRLRSFQDILLDKGLLLLSNPLLRSSPLRRSESDLLSAKSIGKVKKRLSTSERLPPLSGAMFMANSLNPKVSFRISSISVGVSSTSGQALVV